MHLRLHLRLQALAWILVASLLACAVPALGQGTSASLTGRITDPSGAVIPGASVTVVNTDTNLTFTAKTDGVGTYLIRTLPIGPYKLTIEAKGFNRYQQEGIVLTVSMAATQDVHLQVASGKIETVSVTADAELINTSSAELGTTVGETAISQLPLNGRDPSSLVLLAPGTADVKTHGGEGIQSGFSFPTETGSTANGGRQGSTYYLLDGVSNMDNYNLMTAPFPNSDATQEFKVITNNFSAQYGFSPGAVVSIATKNGTNQYHGGAFWFVRNNDLNGADWFSGPGWGTTKSVDPLKRNQFGGFAGGPIKKDKLFFFGNYQGTKSVTGSSSLATKTPTAAMLTGDFSGLATTAGVTNLSGPFHTVGGKANQLDTIIAKLDTAAVTIATTGLPRSSTQGADGSMYYTEPAQHDSFNEFTARLDYDLSAAQRITLRSFTNHLNQGSSDTPGDMLSVINNQNWTYGFGAQMYYFNDVLTHAWTISPTLVNTFNVFWNEQSAHNGAAVLDSSGKAMCLSRYINVQELAGQCYMEGLAVSGGFQVGWTEPSQEVRNTYGISDVVVKTRGTHTLSFGFDALHQYAKEFTQFPTEPEPSFSGQYTGNGLADFLLGYMSGYYQGAGEIAAVSGWQFAPYVQDDWRALPNLTVNFGLRWDPNFAPTSIGGRGAAFVAGQQSTMFTNAPAGLIFPGDNGMTASLMPNSYGYWEPRLGVAWQPKNLPHTVVHAGFGLFTGPLEYSSYNHAADIAPYAPTYSFNGSSCAGGCAANADAAISGWLSFDSPWSSANSGTGGVDPFPPFAGSIKPTSSATFPTGANAVTLGQSFSRNFKLGMTQSWNVSVEQQLTPVMMFRLAYVGSESYHQSYAIDQNAAIKSTTCTGCTNGAAGGNYARPYGRFGQILTDFSGATASYNALQATFDRHMAHGLQVQSSFTWAKTMDVASSSNVSFGKPYLGDPFNLKWSRGNSGMSLPWNSVTNFIYQAPSFKRASKLMQETVGGWEVSSIITFQDGNPFTIMAAGTDWAENDSGSMQYLDRADRVAGQALNAGKGSHWNWVKTGYFNQAAFTQNAAGTFGNSAKNLMFGPRLSYADAAIMKNWALKQGTNLQFRWEAFNATNHPSFATPAAPWGAYVGWGGFGNIVQTGNEPARVMQGALKLTF
jgi:hypothetical protein